MLRAAHAVGFVPGSPLTSTPFERRPAASRGPGERYGFLFRSGMEGVYLALQFDRVLHKYLFVGVEFRQ